MSSSRLVVSVPDELVHGSLEHLSDRVDFILWDMSGPAPVSDIDIVVPPYLRPVTVLEQLHGVRVRLVQSQLNGYDGVDSVLPAGVVYANAASVHESSTAELTLALVLAAQRGIPGFVRSTAAGRWDATWHPSLADRRVLLIGYGGVGKAIESRLLPFETEVTRVASRERIDERGVIYDVESLPRLLPEAEIVIVVVPLTPATTHLVDDEFLSHMARRQSARQCGTRQGRRHGSTHEARPERAVAPRSGRHRSGTTPRRSPALRDAERAHLAPRRRRVVRNAAACCPLDRRADRPDDAGRNAHQHHLPSRECAFMSRGHHLQCAVPKSPLERT